MGEKCYCLSFIHKIAWWREPIAPTTCWYRAILCQCLKLNSGWANCIITGLVFPFWVHFSWLFHFQIVLCGTETSTHQELEMQPFKNSFVVFLVLCSSFRWLLSLSSPLMNAMSLLEKRALFYLTLLKVSAWPGITDLCLSAACVQRGWLKSSNSSCVWTAEIAWLIQEGRKVSTIQDKCQMFFSPGNSK